MAIILSKSSKKKLLAKGKSKVSAPSNKSTKAPKGTTKTSAGYETPDQTVARAKTLLGGTNAKTSAPTSQRLDEIASQSFIAPETKAAYESTKLAPVNQDYLAAKYNAALPKTTVQTSADFVVSPYSSYVAPSGVSPEIGDISLALGGTSGLQGINDFSKNYFQQQLDRQQKFQEGQKGLLQQFKDSFISPADARKEAFKEIGFDQQKYFAQQEAGFKEIEKITNEYNATKAAMESQIAQTGDRLASNSFINNQIAQIERNAAPKLNELSSNINAKASVLQALQGNFAEAQKYVNQAVEDATAMNKYNYDLFTLTYNQNEDAFNAIESVYSDAFKTQLQLAQTAYQEQKADKKAIGDLLLAYPNAGIDIYTDTLDSALQKAGIRAGQLESLSLSGGTGGGVSFSAETIGRLDQILGGFSSMYDYTPSEQGEIRDLAWAMSEPPNNIIQAQEANFRTLSMVTGQPIDVKTMAYEAAKAQWDQIRMDNFGPNTNVRPVDSIPSGKESITLGESEAKELSKLGATKQDIAQLEYLVSTGWDTSQMRSVWGVPTQFVNVLKIN